MAWFFKWTVTGYSTVSMLVHGQNIDCLKQAPTLYPFFEASQRKLQVVVIINDIQEKIIIST